MKFVFNYTRVTNRAESIDVGRLIISSSFNHEFVVTYTNLAGDNQLVIITQGPVVRRTISANPGLNLNLGFPFVCSKALSRIIFSILFTASNHQIVVKKNKTEFAF